MLVYDLPCVEEHNTANTTSFTTSNIIALERILLILILSYSSNGIHMLLAANNTTMINSVIAHTRESYKDGTFRHGQRPEIHTIIGERAKRARRYLVMFMETRDIISYFTSKSGIWLVISRVASYFHEPEASAKTAYE